MVVPTPIPRVSAPPQAALFHNVSCFEFEDLVRIRRAGDGGQVRERVVARVEAQRQRLVIRYADSPAASSVFPLSDVGKINTSASARGAGVTIYGHGAPATPTLELVEDSPAPGLLIADSLFRVLKYCLASRTAAAGPAESRPPRVLPCDAFDRAESAFHAEPRPAVVDRNSVNSRRSPPPPLHPSSAGSSRGPGEGDDPGPGSRRSSLVVAPGKWAGASDSRVTSGGEYAVAEQRSVSDASVANSVPIPLAVVPKPISSHVPRSLARLPSAARRLTPPPPVTPREQPVTPRSFPCPISFPSVASSADDASDPAKPRRPSDPAVDKPSSCHATPVLQPHNPPPAPKPSATSPAPPAAPSPPPAGNRRRVSDPPSCHATPVVQPQNPPPQPSPPVEAPPPRRPQATARSPVPAVSALPGEFPEAHVAVFADRAGGAAAQRPLRPGVACRAQACREVASVFLLLEASLREYDVHPAARKSAAREPTPQPPVGGVTEGLVRVSLHNCSDAAAAASVRIRRHDRVTAVHPADAPGRLAGSLEALRQRVPPFGTRSVCEIVLALNSLGFPTAADLFEAVEVVLEPIFPPPATSVTHRSPACDVEADVGDFHLATRGLEPKAAAARCDKSRGSLLFVDAKFPPSIDSLSVPGLHAVWARGGDAAFSERTQAAVFKTSPKPQQVDQGSLGDGWLVSVIALLAERPSLVHRLFPDAEKRRAGYAKLRLCDHGMWATDYLDNFLPCLPGGGCRFARSSASGLWVSMLEKAVAKRHGSYGALRECAAVRETLEMFTGALCTEHVLRDGANGATGDSLAGLLRDGLTKDALIAVSSSVQPPVFRPETWPDNTVALSTPSSVAAAFNSPLNRWAFAPGMAYVVLRLVAVDTHQYVEVRNPFVVPGDAGGALAGEAGVARLPACVRREVEKRDAELRNLSGLVRGAGRFAGGPTFAEGLADRRHNCWLSLGEVEALFDTITLGRPPAGLDLRFPVRFHSEDAACRNAYGTAPGMICTERIVCIDAKEPLEVTVGLHRTGSVEFDVDGYSRKSRDALPKAPGGVFVVQGSEGDGSVFWTGLQSASTVSMDVSLPAGRHFFVPVVESRGHREVGTLVIHHHSPADWAGSVEVRAVPAAASRGVIQECEERLLRSGAQSGHQDTSYDDRGGKVTTQAAWRWFSMLARNTNDRLSWKIAVDFSKTPVDWLGPRVCEVVVPPGQTRKITTHLLSPAVGMAAAPCVDWDISWQWVHEASPDPPVPLVGLAKLTSPLPASATQAAQVNGHKIELYAEVDVAQLLMDFTRSL
ncbi:Calpain-D [Diplonema papillatum]|nr:Calpain-D [Diplonema papillatum]